MATILVVDDRSANREYLVTLLGYGGHRLLEAAEGEAALAIARAERPDLIVADIVMPTMDGYELARQVRADLAIAETPIIFLTSSYVVAETRSLAQACGVEYIIAKPAEPQVILDMVSAALKTKPILPTPPIPDDFHREHMRLLTDALANRVDALEAEIVERRQAEIALVASEKRFRALIENSTDAISLLDASGRLTYVSPSTFRLLGYTSDEVVGSNPATITHPDDLPGVLSLLGDLTRRPGHTVATHYRVRHKDLSWRWIEASITNLLAEPSVNALVFNYRDITDRVRAEEQQRLQSAALNAAANAVIITDQNGTIQLVNPAFTRLTGYAAEAMLGQNPRLLNSGQQDPAFYERMWATISAGVVWQGELVNRRQDGSFYIQDQTITPVRDAAGQISNYIAIGQDITARKRDEERIHYLATVLENVSNGIVSTDNDLNILSWNAGAEAMFGYRAEEVVGRPYAQVLAYEYLDFNEATVIQQVADIGRWKGEVRVRRRDGTPVYVLVAGALVKDAAGIVTGFSAVLHDITDRRKAEAALAASEAELRALFAAMTDVVLVLGADGRYLQIAPTNPSLLVRPPAELLGRNIHEILPAAEADNIQQQIQLALEADLPIQFDYSLAVGGSQVWFDATISPMGEGRVIWIARDVSERVKREREMEAIAAVSTALRTAITQAEMLPILLEQVVALLDAGAAALAMWDPAINELVVALGQGEMAALAGQHWPAGAGIGGRVMATGQPYVSDNIIADWADQSRAAACVPLITRQHVMGVLWAGRAAPFSDVEVRVLTAIADIAANALQRVVLHEQTEQRLKRLVAQRDIDNAIMNSLDLRMTLGILLGHVMDQLGVDASDILLLSHGVRVLEYVVGRGFRSRAIERSRLRLGEGHAGQAALERRMVTVPDLQADTRDLRGAGLLADEAFSTMICVPLVAKSQVVGVLEVFHRSPLHPDPDWLAFLETLAGQAAIAVTDAKLFSELEQSNLDLLLAYDTTLEGWSAALDLRDKETEGHSQRVTEMTLRLAQALGVRERDLEHMRRGALLHDIGKMGISDAILRKPDTLTEDEWIIMRQHPTIAYQLLSPIAFLGPALDIPYCHHEKWDGSGYPRQLKGDAIPRSARIFAVVDVWDALCSDRPYRPGWPADKVRKYICEQSGQHFDPVVVSAFLEII